MSLPDPLFLLCIAGATGVGKSAVALALAEILPVSVINADSRQVYRDFPLISAQPSPDDRKRCPHLLYGFLPSDKKLGAGEYARLADRVLREEYGKERLPLLVGGAGLYFRTLVKGIAAIPPIPEDLSALWRVFCRELGSVALHGLLREKDPDYARRIHPNDRQRVTRALEVMDFTGRPLSWWHARPLPESPYRAVKIGLHLPLAELEPLLARRVDAMLEAGALEEARQARERCPDPGAPGWSGIGCAELYRHLAGEISLDECRALWLKNTRAYAKRQSTWFGSDASISWFRPEDVRKVTDFVLNLWRGKH
jgi:tRNA dimethylallyltransferase